MASSIHISTLKKMLQSPDPVDLKLWTRSGEIQCWNRCISLRYNFYKGTRRMKLLDSNEIRQLRDVCVCLKLMGWRCLCEGNISTKEYHGIMKYPLASDWLARGLLDEF